MAGNGSTRAKVLVVGWDSAPPKEVFEQWRSHMPNLDRLMRRGAFGTLRSTDPPITVPAWASMLSSQNPGRLGFFGFRNRKVGTYDGRYIATARRYDCRGCGTAVRPRQALLRPTSQTYPRRRRSMGSWSPAS